jgi:predicted HTH transcriptional regulator
MTGDVQPNTGDSVEPSVAELLADMETLKIEFKSTARVPLSSDVPEKVINEGVIKTVAAFMNSHGGTLGIGISDDGDILGIQADLDFKKQDLDGYQNWLATLFMNSIGQSSAAKNVRIRFETVEDNVVCLVDVLPSNKPVYANTVKGKEVFYIRYENTTRVLAGAEMVAYIEERF